MKLLEINHVEKSFDNLTVLKDISLSVEDGEIVSIMDRPAPEIYLAALCHHVRDYGQR